MYDAYTVPWKGFCPLPVYFIFINFFAYLSHLKDSDQTNFNLILNLILNLHKDNASKYRMQFLNDDLLREKSCLNLPGPKWKMNCPQ